MNIEMEVGTLERFRIIESLKPGKTWHIGPAAQAMFHQARTCFAFPVRGHDGCDEIAAWHRLHYWLKTGRLERLERFVCTPDYLPDFKLLSRS